MKLFTTQKIWRNSFDMFDVHSRISMIGYVRRSVRPSVPTFFPPLPKTRLMPGSVSGLVFIFEAGLVLKDVLIFWPI